MKKIFLLASLFIWGLFSYNTNVLAVDWDVKSTLWEIADNRAWEIGVWNERGQWIRDFIVNIWKKIILPIVVVIGLLIAFLWFYKLVFSDKEDERKKWTNFFVWWTIWVIIMVAARFITYSLVWNTWTMGIIWSNTNFDPATIAERFYNDVLHKFFILAMYLVVLVLFVILVINLIKFMSSPDKEDVSKNSKTIIVWNILWIIIIIFAKNIIEMFYRKVNSWATTLWQQAPILESKNIWWLYTVLNYFLGFVAFAVTVFIIYQAFLLLTKPDDEQTYKSLKKYFVYAILWIFLIWWVYIIANFFIIK